MPSFDLTYDDYLRNRPERANVDENGVAPPPMSEEEWNAIPAASRWQNIGNRLSIGPSDPRYAEFAPITGVEEGRSIIVDQGDPEAAYRPDWINNWDQVVVGDGWHAIAENNFSPDWSREQETTRRRARQHGVAGAAAVLTGGLAYGALAGGAGVGAGEAAALGAEGTAGIGAGATGAAEVGGAAGTAAPSFGGVVGGSSTTATSPGLIGSAFDSVSGWYNSLTPAGRLAVNTAISSGAQALGSANAQRNAQQAAEEREERERQDRVRRGSVRPFTGNPYTPRPAGIIGSALTPRPGGG